MNILDFAKCQIACWLSCKYWQSLIFEWYFYPQKVVEPHVAFTSCPAFVLIIKFVIFEKVIDWNIALGENFRQIEHDRVIIVRCPYIFNYKLHQKVDRLDCFLLNSSVNCTDEIQIGFDQ